MLGDLALVLEVLGWFVPLVGAAFQGLAVVPSRRLLPANGPGRRSSPCSPRARSRFSSVAWGSFSKPPSPERSGWRSAPRTGANGPGSCGAGGHGHDRDPGGGDLARGRRLSRPGFRRLAFAQVQILWRDLRRGLRSPASARVGGRHDASLGDRQLVVDGALVRALRRSARGRALRPLPVASARAPRARSARAPADELPRRATASGALGGRGRPNGARAPVPVELERVSYQYPGSMAWAVAEVSLVSSPGRFSPSSARTVRASRPSSVSSPGACRRRSAPCTAQAIPVSGCPAAPR